MHSIIGIFAGIGLSLNLLLIYLILSVKRAYLGTYKYLQVQISVMSATFQLILVLNDISYATCSHFMQEVSKSSFNPTNFLFSENNQKKSTRSHCSSLHLMEIIWFATYRRQSILEIVAYRLLAMFSLIPVVISFNFLYRYWAVVW